MCFDFKLFFYSLAQKTTAESNYYKAMQMVYKVYKDVICIIKVTQRRQVGNESILEKTFYVMEIKLVLV